MQHSYGFELVDKEYETYELYNNFAVNKLIALCESVQITPAFTCIKNEI